MPVKTNNYSILISYLYLRKSDFSFPLHTYPSYLKHSLHIPLRNMFSPLVYTNRLQPYRIRYHLFTLTCTQGDSLSHLQRFSLIPFGNVPTTTGSNPVLTHVTFCLATFQGSQLFIAHYEKDNTLLIDTDHVIELCSRQGTEKKRNVFESQVFFVAVNESDCFGIMFIFGFKTKW